VELSVSTEEREELELARRALHLGAQLPHCIENEPALIRCADDVALRKVVAIAGEREGVASVHVVYARSEERTRVAVVHRSRNVDVDTADPVDEPGESGAVDVDAERDADAEAAADAVGL